ncbi:hypothetical protein BDR26DRAFT_873770 [Obelidium mucronatum]|nr:hypothetical protein BDR26DRAFT_873770 [Obelidium mucronatum]
MINDDELYRLVVDCMGIIGPASVTPGQPLGHEPQHTALDVGLAITDSSSLQHNDSHNNMFLPMIDTSTNSLMPLSPSTTANLSRNHSYASLLDQLNGNSISEYPVFTDWTGFDAAFNSPSLASVSSSIYTSNSSWQGAVARSFSSVSLPSSPVMSHNNPPTHSLSTASLVSLAGPSSSNSLNTVKTAGNSSANTTGRIVKQRQRAISLSDHHYRGVGVSLSTNGVGAGGVTSKNAGKADATNGLMMKAIHPAQQSKAVKCPVPGCFKSYKNRGGLKYHLQHKHPEFETPEE